MSLMFIHERDVKEFGPQSLLVYSLYKRKCALLVK